VTATVPATERARAGRARWWREVLYVLAFYVVYSVIRNTGASTAGRVHAFTNAKRVIRVERLLGLYHEETLQDLFLPARWFIRLWNVYYGSFHFVVTAVALVWCFRRMHERYAQWRNTLALTTGLALIGFAFFPLMPPRLLPASYGFVDTLAEYGGLWSFDSGAMKQISNQYAAMPSLHFGWALWSACVLWHWARARGAWARALLVAYPVLTLFAILVTGNHFWLDAVGGAAVFGAGWLLAQRAVPQKIP
jgi:hypothetical protein